MPRRNQARARRAVAVTAEEALQIVSAQLAVAEAKLRAAALVEQVRAEDQRARAALRSAMTAVMAKYNLPAECDYVLDETALTLTPKDATA